MVLLSHRGSSDNLSTYERFSLPSKSTLGTDAVASRNVKPKLVKECAARSPVRGWRAARDEPVTEMFSFVPYRNVGRKDACFPGPAVSLLGYINPASLGYINPASLGYINPASLGYINPASLGYINPASLGYINPASLGYINPASNGTNGKLGRVDGSTRLSGKGRGPLHHAQPNELLSIRSPPDPCLATDCNTRS